MKAAILGATGYTGQLLLRLLAAHPRVSGILPVSSSRAGEPLRSVDPGLRGMEGKLPADGKLPDGRGGYLYAFSDGESKAGSDKSLIDDFRRGFLSLEFSGNQALVKTLPGHANSVAFALDNLGLREVLGTIAGDDTLLIVPRDGVGRKALLAALQARIPGLEETRS